MHTLINPNKSKIINCLVIPVELSHYPNISYMIFSVFNLDYAVSVTDLLTAS